MERVFGVLFSVFRGTPRQGEWVLACLRGAWDGLIGEKLAAVCEPVAFDGITLLVGVKDPQWEEAVRSVRVELAEKLRSATGGEVRGIKVVGVQLN